VSGSQLSPEKLGAVFEAVVDNVQITRVQPLRYQSSAPDIPLEAPPGSSSAPREGPEPRSPSTDRPPLPPDPSTTCSLGHHA
jgi:hypothetical protein